MPGHSMRRQRKRERAEKRKAKTLAKKEQRRKKKTGKAPVGRVSKLLSKAFEKAGNMASLRSPDEKVREDAFRKLKAELVRLEPITGFRFVVLEDFGVMMFSLGTMNKREVYVYTSNGVTRQRH